MELCVRIVSQLRLLFLCQTYAGQPGIWVKLSFHLFLLHAWGAEILTTISIDAREKASIIPQNQGQFVRSIFLSAMGGRTCISNFNSKTKKKNLPKSSAKREVKSAFCWWISHRRKAVVTQWSACLPSGRLQCFPTNQDLWVNWSLSLALKLHPSKYDQEPTV